MIRCCTLKKSVKASKKANKAKFTNTQICVEALLLFIAVASVYLMLSLISYDPADPGWSQTAWHDPIRNWGGVAGAYLSDVFFQFLGMVAYGIPALIVFLCVQGMVHFYYRFNNPVNYFSLSLRVIGVLAFMFSITGFFALNVVDLKQLPAGGVLGDIVADQMVPIFNHIGASVILIAVCLACVTLLTGLSWLFIAEMIGAFIIMIATPVLTFVTSIFRRSPKEKNEDSDSADPQLETNLPSADAKSSKSTAMDEKQDDTTDNESRLTHRATPDSATFNNDSTPDNTAQIEAEHEQNGAIEAMSQQQNDVAQTVSEESHEIRNSLESDVEQPFIEKNPIANQVNIQNAAPAIFIDENNPPPKLNRSNEPEQQHGFIINPDYYSPITISQPSGRAIAPVTETIAVSESVDIPQAFENDTDESIPFVTLDDDDDIAPVGSYGIVPATPATDEEPVMVSHEEHDDELPVPVTALTKENIHDSLIHPLLQKDNKPLIKPTTPLPSLGLLTAPPVKQVEIDHSALKAMAELIEKSLADFRVKARVVDYLPGPVITRFEIELAPGIKASRISTLDRDLARSLSMPSVRVVEVIPGKPYVGIELPNKNRQTVFFREVLDSPQFKDAQSPLTVVLGKDIAGQSVVADLAKMPHLLVAGTTGSGKSVGVNAMILSILYKSQPEDAKFIMIDPKMLELSVYEGIPHLLTDVVTDMKDACNALSWCVNEMERRYRLMSALGVRNIAGYNEKIKMAEDMGRPIPDPLWRPGDSMDIDMPSLVKLPYIVVMVDEFADLIMAVGKKVEELIARLAQKARAAGIHLVLATQRPSVDVITGLIKANIPTRIAFTVSSKIDSRTILDQMGAESLLGMGDMLYLAPNSSIPVRVHGAFVRDEEVHSVVQDWKARGIPTQYIDNITSSSDEGDSDGYESQEEELDPLFDQVVAFVVDKRRASISSVQRQFRIGYNRAARIVEQMETQGIVSTPSHNGNREVLAPPSGQEY